MAGAGMTFMKKVNNYFKNGVFVFPNAGICDPQQTIYKGSLATERSRYRHLTSLVSYDDVHYVFIVCE